MTRSAVALPLFGSLLAFFSIAVPHALAGSPRFSVTAYKANGDQAQFDCGIGNPNGQCPDFGSAQIPSSYTIYLSSDTTRVNIRPITSEEIPLLIFTGSGATQQQQVDIILGDATAVSTTVPPVTITGQNLSGNLVPVRINGIQAPGFKSRFYGACAGSGAGLDVWQLW